MFMTSWALLQPPVQQSRQYRKTILLVGRVYAQGGVHLKLVGGILASQILGVQGQALGDPKWMHFCWHLLLAVVICLLAWACTRLHCFRRKCPPSLLEREEPPAKGKSQLFPSTKTISAEPGNRIHGFTNLTEELPSRMCKVNLPGSEFPLRSQHVQDPERVQPTKLSTPDRNLLHNSAGKCRLM